CNNLKWSSDNNSDSVFPKTGCNPRVSFSTTGSRKVILTATDSENKKGSTSSTINVTDAPQNTGPIITILNPRPDRGFNPDDSIELKATAKDPDNKGPLSYKWLLSEGNTTLKTGSMNDGSTVSYQWKPSDNVRFHCAGKTVRLYFYATDPDGSTSSSF